jgi:hypothetical protein
MKKENHGQKTFFLAKIAFISFLLTIGSIVLFCMLVSLGMDFGIFVLLAIIFSYVAFFSGLLSTIIIILLHQRFKGLVYSILAMVLSFPMVYFQTEFFMSPNPREKMKKTHIALYNMELLAEKLGKYAQNHDGYLPNADNWCDVLMEHNPELTVENFRHPMPDLLKLKGKCHIAFNKALSGKRLADISPDTVLLFEADGDWNLNGTSSLLDSKHGEKLFVRILFVDGSESSYWFDKKAVRKFKSKFGRSSMYYEQPRWLP